MNTTGRGEEERPGRLDEVLAEYMERIDRGEAVDRQRFLAQHPDLADDLRRYFEESDEVERLAAASERSRETQLTPMGITPAERPVPVRDTEVLRRFGDYQLLTVIARGQRSIVYRARHLASARVVALKRLLAGQFASPADLRRFRSRAETASRLNHPRIVPVFEIGECDGQPYFTMELMEGGSLAQAASSGGWVVGSKEMQRHVAALVAEIARTVQDAHQQGVVHGELNADSILRDLAGRWYVAGFGQPLPAAELANPGPAEDVYGLGTLLCEVLSGPQSSRGQSGFPRPQTGSGVGPPHVLRLLVDPDLERICLQCRAKDAQHRYPSAEAVAEDLERWLAGQPIYARRPSVVERLFHWAGRRFGSGGEG